MSRITDIIALLTSIDASLKTLAARTEQRRQYAKRAEEGRAAKPCLTCSLAPTCQTPCSNLETWRAATGLEETGGPPKKLLKGRS